MAHVISDAYGLRRLDVEKNRHAGGLFSAYFSLGVGGVGKPVFKQAYCVEGQPGAYRLVPYPTRGAEWHGLIDTMEKGEIEGTASAA